MTYVESLGCFADPSCAPSGGAVTYADVQPIFEDHCAPCHTTGFSGQHQIGSTYAQAEFSSYSCPNASKGECAVIRTLDGSMPPGAGGAMVVSPAEADTLQAWIEDGMLP